MLALLGAMARNTRGAPKDRREAAVALLDELRKGNGDGGNDSGDPRFAGREANAVISLPANGTELDENRLPLYPELCLQHDELSPHQREIAAKLGRLEELDEIAALAEQIGRAKRARAL